MLSAAIIFKNRILNHEFLLMLQFNMLSAATSFLFYIRLLCTSLETWYAMHTDHD